MAFFFENLKETYCNSFCTQPPSERVGLSNKQRMNERQANKAVLSCMNAWPLYLWREGVSSFFLIKFLPSLLLAMIERVLFFSHGFPSIFTAQWTRGVPSVMHPTKMFVSWKTLAGWHRKDGNQRKIQYCHTGSLAVFQKALPKANGFSTTTVRSQQRT